MSTPYRPIACGAYDQLEVLAMHRTRVCLDWVDEHGAEKCCHGQVVNTRVADGAEFLLLDSAGQGVEVRLDRIRQIADELGRVVWRQ